MCNIFEVNNNRIKLDAKSRFKNKFDWLLSYNRTAQPARHVTVVNPPVVEPVENRVTAIGVELTAAEQAILALGPNFALSPHIDEKLLQSVRISIAETAYKLRWIKFLEETSTVQSRLQHVKQKGCPFERPFASTPPNHNPHQEHVLQQLSYFVIDKLEHTRVRSNQTPLQAEGLKSILSRLGSLHLSRSDKGEEFVVMKGDMHKQLTTNHIDIMSTTGVYQYQPPTRMNNNRVQPIAQPTATSFNRQIKARVTLLEDNANELWSDICSRRLFECKL